MAAERRNMYADIAKGGKTTTTYWKRDELWKKQSYAHVSPSACYNLQLALEEGVERLRSGQGGKVVLISWINAC